MLVHADGSPVFKEEIVKKKVVSEEEPRLVRGSPIIMGVPEYGDMTLADFISSLQDELTRLEALGRTEIHVKLETQYGYYDESVHELQVTYKRLETDKEVAARIKKSRIAKNAAKLSKKNTIEKERKELARLQKKYG